MKLSATARFAYLWIIFFLTDSSLGSSISYAANNGESYEILVQQLIDVNNFNALADSSKSKSNLPVVNKVEGKDQILNRMQSLRLRAIQEHADRDYPKAPKTMDNLFAIFYQKGCRNWDFEISSYLLQIQFLIDSQDPSRIENIFKNKLYINAETGKVEFPLTLNSQEPTDLGKYKNKVLKIQAKYLNLIPLYYADYLRSQRDYKKALIIYTKILASYPSNFKFQKIIDRAIYYEALLGQLACAKKSELSIDRQQTIKKYINALKSIVIKNKYPHDLLQAHVEGIVSGLDYSFFRYDSYFDPYIISLYMLSEIGVDDKKVMIKKHK